MNTAIPHRSPTKGEWPILDALTLHRYDSRANPEDVGLGRCGCGLDMYWSQYEPHVAHMVAEAVQGQRVERLAQMLEKWADLRLGYLRHRGISDPQTSNDIEKLDRNDLTLWAEAEGVRHAAQLIRAPRETMSIPTWLEPDWDAYLAKEGF